MSDAALDPKQIFLEALDREPPEERLRYLDEACGDNAEARARVEALLRAHEEVGNFLGGPPPDTPTLDQPPIEGLGTQIGPYKLLQEIGQGGMGVVYMAEQREPVERRVALKIIKPGMDTQQVIARFQAERQALAMMDHPNIAKVLDAGTTDSGRPYFVMELVKGIPITQYCDDHQLTPRQRLELFVPVCHAGQHAHQKGIIHRDIKPTNVLVAEYDDCPVPKIIDFGVAKAIQQRLTERTVFTQLGQVVGTIDYMSPEQAKLNQLDVDTRSDIYSLGVLLYELLTGETPFDRQRLHAAAFDELLRIIREEEPPKPSHRLSGSQSLPSIAANRQIEPARLSTLVRGELDWIVMKAMEKDRGRRYETANAFAADVEHYLADEPVVACPPSAAYRLRKFYRRNKGPVVGVSLVLLALVAGIIGTTWGLLRAERARQDAVTAQIAEATQRKRAEEKEAFAKQQEQLARQQEALAEKQQKIAVQQKAESERQWDAAEYRRYISDMRLAQNDFAAGHTERLFRLLDAQIPEPGRPDLRGWEWWCLFSQCHTERFSFPSQIQPLAWSSDGRYLATVETFWKSNIGVNVWDVASSKRKTSLRGCPGWILSMSWSPDGKYLAAGNDRNTIVIWESASGSKLRSLHGHTGTVGSVVWNPDSVRLASGGADGTIRIWNAHTADTLTVRSVPSKNVWTLDWHPDGRHLLVTFGSVGLADLKIWDTTSGRDTEGWPIAYAGPAKLSPDGTRVAYTEEAQRLRIRDLRTHEIVDSRAPRPRRSPAWSPDGSRLASTTDNGPIVICDAKTGEVVSSTLTNADAYIPPVWSPNGRFIAAICCIDRTVKVWDIDALPPLVALPMATEPGTTVAFSPDGRRLLAAIGSGTLKLVDVGSGKEALSVQYDKDKTSVLGSAAWSPDGKRFAVRVRPDNVIVVDARTGKQMLPLLPCGGTVTSVAWRPDGTILALGVFDDKRLRGHIKLFSANTGKRVATSTYGSAQAQTTFFFGDSHGEHECIAWRPDGTRLATAGTSLRVWDPASLQDSPLADVRVSPPAGKFFSALCWSPDGTRLAVGLGVGRDIRVYETTTGVPAEVVGVLKGHTDAVRALSWHPFMPRLASGSADGTVRLWDTATGEEVGVLHAGAARLHTVTWSPDGLRLAWTTEDGPVRIWDASIADRYFKNHGDVRAKATALQLRLQYQEAIDLLEQLRKLHPDEDDLPMRILHLRWILAAGSAINGRGNEAITRFNQLSAQSPDLPDYRLLVPEPVFRKGREPEAIEMLEKAIAEFPQRPEYHEELAYLYERRAIRLCQSGEVASAIPLLYKLAEEFPERPAHRSQVVRELTAELPPEKAVETLKTLMQEFPDAAEYRQAVNELPLEDCRRRAGGHLKSGPWADAVRESFKAIEFKPDEWWFYHERACCYLWLRQYRETLADYTRVVELHPGDWGNWGRRGPAFLKLGRGEEAVADYGKAVDLWRLKMERVARGESARWGQPENWNFGSIADLVRAQAKPAEVRVLYEKLEAAWPDELEVENRPSATGKRNGEP